MPTGAIRVKQAVLLSLAMAACLGAVQVQAQPAKANRSAKAASPTDNYTLRQAIIAWDMLSKVDMLCPDGDADRRARRLEELETTARRRLKSSAKAMLEKLADEAPPVLMTPEQAVRVVSNAGGCRTEALAQWRGRAAFVADTSRQVLAGEARADRVWPRDAALEQPVRISVLGQQPDAAQGGGVWITVSNRASVPARFALLGPQTFVGLCTRLTVTGAPMDPGYAPRDWLNIPPHSDVSMLLVRDKSCPAQGRVNVGGAAVIDMGAGPRYWRFLARGVGAMRAGTSPVGLNP